MIRIVIVEDEEKIANQLKKYLMQYGENQGLA